MAHLRAGALMSVVAALGAPACALYVEGRMACDPEDDRCPPPSRCVGGECRRLGSEDDQDLCLTPLTCAECTTHSGCGYCEADRVCTTGDDLGPWLRSCHAGWRWYPDDCTDEPEDPPPENDEQRWVTIRAGTFTRGSPASELGSEVDEHQRETEISRDILMLATEVTQRSFERAMGYNPAYFRECGPTCPVEQVSWDEAAAYCNALSQHSGLPACFDCVGSGASVTCSPAAAYADPYSCPGYRLPTEAEWEYAARAGTTTATYEGDLAGLDCPSAVLNRIAWTRCNSMQWTRSVGSLLPNPWGMLDMLGNVWEWCFDSYAAYPPGPSADPWEPALASAHVMRGGGWSSEPREARAANRNYDNSSPRFMNVGFRPVRSLSRWVRVTAGTFVMGSPAGELGRQDDEVQHTVTIVRDFEIQTSEVTQGQFRARMGYNPSAFPECGPDCPVDFVSWHEAAEYCNALSEAEGLDTCYDCATSTGGLDCTPAFAFGAPQDCPGYRLPTEAEWEYAARAGTTTATYAGDISSLDCPEPVTDPIAWTSCNSGGAVRPVGAKESNALGVFDMLGSLFEWCHDWYGPYPTGEMVDVGGPDSGSDHVARGGSYFHYVEFARAALRTGWSGLGSFIGFRPVRSVP